MKYLAHLISGRPAIAFAETSEDRRVIKAKLEATGATFLGSFDTLGAASLKANAEADDVASVCSMPHEGQRRGRGCYRCPACQEATLLPGLVASLAACRAPGRKSA